LAAFSFLLSRRIFFWMGWLNQVFTRLAQSLWKCWLGMTAKISNVREKQAPTTLAPLYRCCASPLLQKARQITGSMSPTLVDDFVAAICGSDQNRIFIRQPASTVPSDVNHRGTDKSTYSQDLNRLLRTTLSICSELRTRCHNFKPTHSFIVERWSLAEFCSYACNTLMRCADTN
jgi:hypothetical protein